MKAAHTIQTLWQYAAPQIPDALLAHLASGEDAANSLRDIARLMEGLGGGLAAGAPAEHLDWPSLLLGLSGAIATQAELVVVASDAQAMQRQRRATAVANRGGVVP